jgi:hypothetical protein
LNEPQPPQGAQAARRPRPAWGSASGALEFRNAPGGSDPDTELQRWLVRERVYRYGWAFDERRPDVLMSCFDQDATWSANLMGESEVPTIRGRDQIVRWLSAFWDRQGDQRRHLMMSMTVDGLTERHATAVTSLLLLSATAMPSLSVALTSFYRFGMVRRDGLWLITSLFEGCDAPF